VNEISAAGLDNIDLVLIVWTLRIGSHGLVKAEFECAVLQQNAINGPFRLGRYAQRVLDSKSLGHVPAPGSLSYDFRIFQRISESLSDAAQSFNRLI
jgi:hypothetical protein